MRGALPVTITILGVLTGCGGASTTAGAARREDGTPSSRVAVTSGSSQSREAGREPGTPLPTTPAVRTGSPSPHSPVATLAARTATSAPPPGPCPAAGLGITTLTDAGHYGAGQMVQVRVVVRNLGPSSCTFDGTGDFTIEGDPTGPTVYAVHLACPGDGCPPLAPGQMTTYPIPWNQTANQGSGVDQRAAPGAYHARAVFTGRPASTSAPFTLVP